MASPDAVEAVGNTPLVRLNRVPPKGCARVYAKLEYANPTGSMKDRAAKAIIEGAVARRKISAGSTVVEYTAGTTGISLAFVCAARGYALHLVFSDAFSEDKRRTMRAFGAQITDVKSDRKRITAKLIRAMIERAAEISQRPHHWYSDQLRNEDAVAGYHPLGEEMWTQTGGEIDAFVHVVGTAHSIHGATQSLWRHRRGIHIAAVEPAESPVLSGGETGSHRIEGIGIGFVPPLWDPGLVNEIRRVSSSDAQKMARRLAREEGLFVGTSSGANVVAALEVGRRLGPKATVVTVMVDSGLRYLSTGLFSKS
jgi:cysteine synthase